MENKFDPYRKWLGIAPKDQPPNKYRLLGIDLFEEDPDVIANAADQRMSHVRTFQSGKHSDLSQRILGELSSAKLTLLDADRKAEYDAELKSQVAGASPPPPPGNAPPRPSSPPPVASQSQPTPDPPAPSVAVAEPAAPIISPGVSSASPRSSSVAARTRRKQSSAAPILISLVLGLVILVVAIVVYNLISGDSDSTSRDKGDSTTLADRKRTGGESFPDPGAGIRNRTPLKISSIGSQQVATGDELEVVIRASGSRLNYSLEEAPPGVRLDENSGVLTWRPLAKEPGETFYVTVRVTDPYGRSASTRFPVEVVEPQLESDSRGLLQATYFADRELNNAAVRRNDPNIDFAWGQGPPAPGLPDDNFSIRWTGWLRAPETGEYRISVFVDDGVRVWIDDELVIDAWTLGVLREVSKELELTRGRHSIRVEYFDIFADAIIKLRWRTPDGTSEIIPPSAFRPERGSRAGGSDDDDDVADNEPGEQQPAPMELSPKQRQVRLLSQGILSFGGSLRIAGRAEPLAAGDPLPPGELDVRTVEIDNDRLEDKHLEALRLFANLDRLAVASRNVTDEGMSFVGQLERLEELELRTPQVTDAGLLPLTELPRLRRLYLGSESVTNRAFVLLKRMPRLESLAITSDQLTGDDVNELSELESLRQLTIASGGLRDFDLKPFRALDQLQLLALNGPISAEGLVNLSGLQVPLLAITSPQIDDRSLAALRGLPNLQALRLTSAEIGDEGCALLAECPLLTQIELMNAGGVTSTGARRLLQNPRLKQIRLVGADISAEELDELRSRTETKIAIE